MTPAPFDPKSEWPDTMEGSVAILGAKGGAAIGLGFNMPTSILLQVAGQTILVEAGLGAGKAVCDQRVALADTGMQV